METLGTRWSIFIDIEGFGAIYGEHDQALASLRTLMEGVYAIGAKCYSESPDRIFAHQIADGFIIVSEFGSRSLEVPAAIAISLMRHVLAAGGTTKAAIAEGDFADIQAYYPQVVREQKTEESRVRMGGGIMTIFPVMGTAQINAVGLADKSPSGALLVSHSSLRDRLPSEIPATTVDAKSDTIIVFDWLHADISLVSEIQEKADLDRSTSQDLASDLERYVDENELKMEWIENTRNYLNLSS